MNKLSDLCAVSSAEFQTLDKGDMRRFVMKSDYDALLDIARRYEKDREIAIEALKELANWDFEADGPNGDAQLAKKTLAIIDATERD